MGLMNYRIVYHHISLSFHRLSILMVLHGDFMVILWPIGGDVSWIYGEVLGICNHDHPTKWWNSHAFRFQTIFCKFHNHMTSFRTMACPPTSQVVEWFPIGVISSP